MNLLKRLLAKWKVIMSEPEDEEDDIVVQPKKIVKEDNKKKTKEGEVDIFNYQGIEKLSHREMENLNDKIIRGNPEGEYGANLEG